MFNLTSVFGEGGVILRERNFQVLMIASIVSPLGSLLVSPILDSLIEPLGTTAGNIGLIVSLFTLPGIFMIPVAGAIADRYGRKPVLVFSMLLFGSAGCAIAFTTDFRVVLILRLLQGIAYAGVLPIIITSIGDLYTGNEEATGQGIRFMVSGLSATIFPIIAGVVVLIAWQLSFLLYAVAIPIAIVVYLLMDEPTDTTAKDKLAAEDEAATKSYLKELFRLSKRRRVFAILIARALPQVVWMGFVTYNSIIIVHLLDGSAFEAGVMAAIGSFSFALAASQISRISAFFNREYTPLIVANLLLLGGFSTLLFSPLLILGAVGVVSIGFGVGITLSLYRSVITQFAPDHLRGGLVSLSEAGDRTMATLTPIGIGLLITATTPIFGFSGAIQFSGITTAVGAVGVSIICLLVAMRAQPVAPNRESTTES